ncbi:hypothetical protein [Streptomyces zingiberis]|uniref:Serine/threonine protein kinase n=1 Tax=Streptomyces zingiberis TaxID=2053010 RepID=A0ABX1BYH2_9ACTN|nr:hypothetical protein [Streptomyces zingiberis]NJQ00369.1 hypothetical protein [Streptomyces zingiberis]
MTAWIAAGATIVAALITVLVPLLGSSGGEETTGGAPAAVPSAPPSSPAPGSVPAPASPSPSEETGTPGPDPGSSPAGSELWRGSLLLGTEPKDLDAGQPAAVGYSDEGDVYLLPGGEIEGWNGTVVSLWSGGTDRAPGYEECANTVQAEGARKQRLARNTVLCVRTGAGNIARLELTELDPGGRSGTFGVIIWSVAGRS